MKQNSTDHEIEMPPLIDTEKSQRDYNLPIYGIRGVFSLSSNVSVPYFSTLLDLKRVTKELKTHEEIAPSLENTYTLAELFQREINLSRVRNEIVDGFLKAHDKLKFFNSITVVLLPKDQSGKVLANFIDYDDAKPSFENDMFDRFFDSPKNNHAIFGGVQFISTSSASLSRLRWDNTRVDAVVVDGQHRLTALKEWMRDKHGELTETEKPTRISVLFVLLHEKVGFNASSSGNKANTIKGIAREIFTDLNKNAKEVDLATQIILDDRNLESCCVRSLITSRTCQNSDTLLPLSLLRWREANNRFDNSYYLNSLVNLHLIIEDAIDIELPREPMDANSVRGYINSLEERLGTGAPGERKIEVDGKSLLAYYNDTYFDAGAAEDMDTPVAPFSSIPSSYLNATVKGFEENYAPWLLKILREFQPYKAVLAYANENNLIDGEFSQFLAQPSSARVALQKDLEYKYKDQWYELIIGRHEKAISGIKAFRDINLGEQWAFKTIFQKAFVRLGKQIAVEMPREETSRLGDIDDLISFFGKLYQGNLLRIYSNCPNITHHLWTTIAVNVGNRKIKVSAQTEKRIEALLRLWYFGYRYALSNNIQMSEDFHTDIYKNISTILSHSQWLCRDSCELLMDVLAKDAINYDPYRFAPDISEADKKLISNRVAKERLTLVLRAGWEAGMGVVQIGPGNAPSVVKSDFEMI
jgi:hypothetical protein